MQKFTTRPEIRGNFGVVTSTILSRHITNSRDSFAEVHYQVAGADNVCSILWRGGGRDRVVTAVGCTRNQEQGRNEADGKRSNAPGE